MLAGKRALRCVEGSDKQGILSLRQRDGGTIGVGEAPTAPIELPAAEPATAARRIPWRCKAPGIPSQYGPHARQKLANAEWRGDTVIGTRLEPHHRVHVVPAPIGDDDHPDIGARPDIPPQGEPRV